MMGSRSGRQRGGVRVVDRTDYPFGYFAVTPGRVYPEREVNDILREVNPDVSTLRRELIDYRWLHRADGRYWVAEEVPERVGSEAQEVPSDEAARLARLWSRPHA